MILTKQDAQYASQVFIDYYKNFGRIDDYLRKVKLERMEDMPTPLFGYGPEDEMFQDFTMHPEDMQFVCREMPNDLYDNYLEIVTSHAIEKSVPGKNLKWVVYEVNTNKIVGFIRFGSPTINSKPRNDFLGRPLQTTNMEVMKRFNDSAIMGFIIVPTQPFGFNYLGGKLLAGICCSHLARRTLSKKYNADFCMFETTSLYGSTKQVSQYDGMKPFLRYAGLTDSDFAPALNDQKYRDLKKWFEDKNDGQPLIDPMATSKKLKTQTKMISIIRNSLEGKDLETFKTALADAKGLTEKKRTFISTYGYDNVADYLNLQTDTLIKRPNYDRFELEEIVKWWKKLAGKRFDKLKTDGRIRTELEVWNKNPDIDIIR